MVIHGNIVVNNGKYGGFHSHGGVPQPHHNRWLLFVNGKVPTLKMDDEKVSG